MKNNLAVINAIIDEYYLCRSTPSRLLKRLIVAIKGLNEELRQKYEKLCETRIHNVGDDNQAFLIEELFNAEAEEILGEVAKEA